jgi:hypothetical protein
MRRLAIFIAACALGALAPGVHADPEETDPDLAKHDTDYAAARKAIAAKNWSEAVAKLTGDLAGAQKHRELLQGICLLGCEELADLDKAIAEYKKKN